jgi:fumarate reductase subunit C
MTRQISTIPVQWFAIVLQAALIGHENTPRALLAMLSTVDGPKPQPVAFVAPELFKSISARPLR